MRVGLMGGSFDPVHYGHLRAAQGALEVFGLHAIRLMPARQSPFKAACLASPEHRSAMLSLATEDNPALAVEDCELEREAPSYTVDSLRLLIARAPDHQFTLIIGSDAASGLEGWREITEVRRLAEIRVLARPQDTSRVSNSLNPCPFEGLGVSSTAVRSAVKAGKSIRYLTPESVRRYIEENGLYK